MDDKLQVVVKESGLPAEEGMGVVQNYAPFLERFEEIRELANKIDYKNPGDIDEKIARDLRLKIVKIRTGVDALMKERKRIYILHGNLEQAARNLIDATCKLAEEQLLNVEKAREIAEAKRINAIRLERTEELAPYDWQNNGSVDIGKLDENTYRIMKTGIKKDYYDRIETERKAEEQRIAEAEANRIENERIRLDNTRLQKEAEEREKKAAAERELAKKIAEEEKKKADARLAATEAKAKIEREEAAAKQRDAEEKAKQFREAAEKAAKEASVCAEKERARLKAEADELKRRLDSQVECPYCHKKFVPGEKHDSKELTLAL